MLCASLEVLGNLEPRKGMAWPLKMGHTLSHRLTEVGEGLHCGLKGSNRENGGGEKGMG